MSVSSGDVLGDGPDALLLLHGAFGSRESWGAVAPRLLALLPAGMRVVSADLPGHGKAMRRAVTTLGSAVDDVVATARSVEARRLVVVGHSMGGTLLAAAERRLITEVALVGAVYVDAPFSTEPRDEPVSALAERVAAAVAQRTGTALREARPELPAEVVAAEARAAADVDPLAVAQLIADAAGRSLLPSFGCASLLLLAGSDDSQVPESDVELACEHGARVQVVTGAGHGVYADQPEAFAAAVAAFVASVSPRG